MNSEKEDKKELASQINNNSKIGTIRIKKINTDTVLAQYEILLRNTEKNTARDMIQKMEHLKRMVTQNDKLITVLKDRKIDLLKKWQAAILARNLCERQNVDMSSGDSVSKLFLDENQNKNWSKLLLDTNDKHFYILTPVNTECCIFFKYSFGDTTFSQTNELDYADKLNNKLRLVLEILKSRNKARMQILSNIKHELNSLNEPYRSGRLGERRKGKRRRMKKVFSYLFRCVSKSE